MVHQPELDAILNKVQACVRIDQRTRDVALDDTHLRALLHECLVREPEDVLEIGLGWGYSAAAIQSLPSVRRHRIIEKLHDTDRLVAAEANIAACRSSAIDFDIVWEDSALALPALWRSGDTFDVILIDGGHRFENVFLDFFYAGKLARAGTLVALDDTWMPAVAAALSFFEQNFADQWRPLAAGDAGALRLYEHTGRREKRAWDYFVPFAAGGDACPV